MNEHPETLDEWTLYTFRPPAPDDVVQFWRRVILPRELAMLPGRGGPEQWIGRARELAPDFNVFGLYWCSLPPRPSA